MFLAEPDIEFAEMTGRLVRPGFADSPTVSIYRGELVDERDVPPS
jgi:hypothetical protein